MKKISIIVDNPQRDLAGYTYLAEELVKKNYLVFLTPMYNFHEIFLINPDMSCGTKKLYCHPFASV